jgi:thioredoxin reductase
VHVHNFLARDGIPPGELLAAGRAEVTGYGAEIVTGSVVGLRALDGGGFEVRLTGQVVRGRRLLVATGLVDELPAVPGLAERWGRTVLHCPYCHGWEVRDQAIGILGTGPLAVPAALLWRQWSADVTLFRPIAPTASERERLDARGIAVEPSPVAGVEGGADVRLADGRLVPRQALVVTPAFTARTDLLAPLGLAPVPMEMDGTVLGSYLAAGPTGATAVPGVYAAGNVTDPRAQVIGSAAAGLLAGAAINGDLIEEDTRRAVAGLLPEGAR